MGPRGISFGKKVQARVRDFIRQNTKLEFASAGDSHGDLRKVQRFVRDCLSEEMLSLIILGGDYQRQPTKNLVEARENVSHILSTLTGCPRRVLVFGGNYELPGVTADVASRIGEPLFPIGCGPRIDERYPGNHLSFQGFNFIGVEGSNPINALFPGERSEEELEWALAQASRSMGAAEFSKAILVTHSPPYECGSRDKLGLFGLPPEYCGKHVGSLAYRNYIMDRRPLIHDCGHIHEGVGVTVHLWNREGEMESEDINMVEYEKIALLLKKDQMIRATICANHGTLEHWMYFRYRIAETNEWIGVEAAKRRLGGKDALSRFTDRFHASAIYKKIFCPNADLREILS